MIGGGRQTIGGSDAHYRRKWGGCLCSFSGAALPGRMEASGSLSAEVLRERLLQGLEAEHVVSVEPLLAGVPLQLCPGGPPPPVVGLGGREWG